MRKPAKLGVDSPLLRVAVSMLVASVVGWSLAAAAAPLPTATRRVPARTGPSKPTGVAIASAPDQLARLDKEYAALTAKKATFAALKVAREAVALQIQVTGPDSPQVALRKMTLSELLISIKDYHGALVLDQERLATEERLHGPEYWASFVVAGDNSPIR